MIPLLIGKNSSGEDQVIDLSDIGLLMISYCEEEQFMGMFERILNAPDSHKSFNYIITNSRRIDEWKIGTDNSNVFLKDEPEMGTLQTRLELLSMINKEMIRRKGIMLKKKVKDFERYVSLNTWNQEKLTHSFLLIDDIWDIVTAKPKSLALNLINIFLNGPSVGIHTVFASGISYRNLLEQLVTINPKIKIELQNKYGIPEPTRINSMGHEIIYSPDGLIFYKDAVNNELMKLYP